MREQPKDSLRPWLHAWAKWRKGSGRTGYASETTLYKAAKGQGHAPFGPRIPDGVIPHPSLDIEILSVAMGQLMEDYRTCYAISMVQDWYLLGGGKEVAKERKISERKAAEIRNQGEAMLRAWLCARGY